MKHKEKPYFIIPDENSPFKSDWPKCEVKEPIQSTQYIQIEPVELLEPLEDDCE